MINLPGGSRLISSPRYNLSICRFLSPNILTYLQVLNSLQFHSFDPIHYSTMSNNSILDNLTLLRDFMGKNNLDAHIIHHNDPHFTEVPHISFGHLAFISGFTGSYGTGLVTMDQALIWVDGRYYIQAELQLDSKLWTIMKYGSKGVLPPLEWLKKSNLKRISFDANAMPQSQYSDALYKLSGKELVPLSSNPLDEIWRDRPSLPDSKAFILDIKYTGKSYSDKLNIVKEKMKEKNATCLIVTDLDEVAYLFNLRGNDTLDSPLLYAYATVTDKETILFIDGNKLTDEVLQYLKENNVRVMGYNQIFNYLENMPKDTIFWASNRANYNIILKTGKQFTIDNKVIAGETPISLIKAVKNDVELQGMKMAHIYDGMALCRLFAHLNELKLNGSLFDMNEYDISRISSQYRLEMPLSRGDSFSPISSIGSNAAIIHYRPDENNSAKITPNIYLLDSGGQYLCGTTDVTRTIHFGNPTENEKHDYTLVLKGHLGLKNAIFPHNTVGNSLDSLARIHLWNEGKNYNHGTGHGVGSFLNVHEGPSHIGTTREGKSIEYALKPGMVLSNEPGYYKPGEYGIRIENMVFVKEAEFSDFYTFEDLTMVPYCRELIDTSIMSNNEITWLNNYHKQVYDTLIKYLDEGGATYSGAREYLIEATKPYPMNK